MESEKIVVVGVAGHVGLPLALALADKGFPTVSLDVNLKHVEQIKNGKSPFLEEGIDQCLKRNLSNGNFTVTSDPLTLLSAEVIIIVVGTPVDEFLSPDPNHVANICRELTKYMRNGQLLILRSTLFPGVTRNIEKVMIEEKLNIDVAYCPERILQGKALREIQELPQIIGARTEFVADRVKSIFMRLNHNLLVSSPEEAELAKLFTNVWRYMKFAISNQFWMISNDLEVDYKKVMNLVTRDYPRASDLPGPGLSAGPCLFKDTMQLAATLSHSFPLGNAAMMINEGLPSYIVKRLKLKYELDKMTVGILGAAFKAEVDDIRGSLSYKLRKILKFECRNVLMSDPYVKDVRLVSIGQLIEDSDLIIIATPHKSYLELEINKPTVDVWGIFETDLLI